MRKEKGGCHQACPLFSFVLFGFNRLRPMFWKFCEVFDTCTLPRLAFVTYALMAWQKGMAQALKLGALKNYRKVLRAYYAG